MTRTRITTLVATLALTCFGGCAGTPSRPAPTARPAAVADDTAHLAGTRHAIASLATQMVGVPYRYGGASPNEGFDCSGLVFFAFGSHGVVVPRNSQQLYSASRKVSLESAAPADLVFFQDQSKLSHVGIYLGDGLFVHAPSAGQAVSVASLDAPYYRRHLVGVGRLIAD